MNAFVVNSRDNVATALSDLDAGEIQLLGETTSSAITAVGSTRSGHKIALMDIATGGPVIKFGVAIGIASRPIPAGSWIHLHNLKSSFDERSGTLDLDTGAPTEEDVYQ